MAMPDVLALVRHGESVGNVANWQARHGDPSLFTERFRQTPESRWHLTETGRAQARATGAWLRDAAGGFDLFYVSPYARTLETAAVLGLPDARWRLNRALRERDRGDVGSLPSDEVATTPWWAANAGLAGRDPLYWSPPNGESIADVAENRVRNILDTLHRDADSERVVLVTHGETMMAFRLVLERLDDGRFVTLLRDPSERIENCGVIIYSRVDPHTGERDRQLRWTRRAWPSRADDGWSVQVSGWRRLDAPTLGNAELLALAGALAERA